MTNLFSIAKEWARDPALMGALQPVVAVAVVAMIICVGYVVLGEHEGKKKALGICLKTLATAAFLALGLFVFTFAYAHYYGEGRFGCPTFETQRYVIERGE